MSTKISNKTFLGGLAVALVLPLSFYFITKVYLGKHNIHLPPRYIVEGVDSQVVNGKMHYDTVYHKVSDLVLTNQLGKQISINKDLAGKALVINFFFVNCPTICPRLTGNIAHFLQNAFKKNDSTVHFLSLTVNPVHDSFPVLRAYADHYNVNHDHWWFLTGDKKTIYDFARNQLFVSVQPGDGGPDDFIHTEKIVLVDKHRNIRGYYNGLDTAELRRCADDLALLTIEKDKSEKK